MAETRYRVEALIQLGVYTILGIAAARYVYSLDGLFFLIASWVFIFVTLAGGWPYSPPLGSLNGSLYRRGLFMTSLTLAASLATYTASTYLLGGRNLQYMVVLLLWIVAVWGVVFDSWPLRHLPPSRAFILGSLTSISLSLVLGVIAANLVGYELLLRFMLVHLALSFMFSRFFVFQGYPFYRKLFRQPRAGVSIMLLCMAAAAFLSLLITPDRFPAAAFFSSMLLWSVVYSWGLGFPGTVGYKQPLRGLLSALVIVVISAAWFSTLLQLLQEALIAVLNLLIILPLMVIHNLFWFRRPFSPPLLMGMPFHNRDGAGKLMDWALQVVD